MRKARKKLPNVPMGICRRPTIPKKPAIFGRSRLPGLTTKHKEGDRGNGGKTDDWIPYMYLITHVTHTRLYQSDISDGRRREGQKRQGGRKRGDFFTPVSEWVFLVGKLGR